MMELGRANLEEFGATLVGLGQKNKNLLVVTSDSRGSAKLVAFGEQLPDQIIEMGIAEQNLVGVSAGLAAAGKIVFAVSPACFLTARSLEQIKNDVAYSDRPVKLVGISAGVSYGALGSTHHSLHDYAVLRAINNIDIVSPADNFETQAAITASIDYPRPIYIRFGKSARPHLHQPDSRFEIGRAMTVADGSDITIIATGEPLLEAVQAAQLLAAEGISCRVISMHTLKPLDVEAVLQAARETRAIITVEEHSVHGGLGSACAELLAQSRAWIPFKIFGIPDEYTVTGSQSQIFAHYGITPENLANTAKKLLKN